MSMVATENRNVIPRFANFCAVLGWGSGSENQSMGAKPQATPATGSKDMVLGQALLTSVPPK
eukprot:5852157-Amphidinium_carterae.1